MRSSSRAQQIAAEVAALPDPHAALDELLAGLTTVELAALWYDWPLWARTQQLIDLSSIRTHGFLAGRRVGKTLAHVQAVVAEVMAGRAARVGFCAQNEDKTIEVLVHGECGLLACSPPWFRARWELGRVVWPNGAQAFPFTPEVPGAFRGPGLHLFLATELQSWPSTTMFEAWGNVRLMTSLGAARVLWEATVKSKHPLIAQLLAHAAAHPAEHVVTRGSIDDNAINLGAGVVEALHAELDGTQRGREELDGVWSDDDESALWRQAWIDDHRRPLPSQLSRRVIALDPAIGVSEDSDASGVAEVGASRDGHVFVIADLSGKYEGDTLASLAIERYVAGDCDTLLVETNRGGSTWAALLRAVAGRHRVRIEIVGADWTPRRVAGVVHVREVSSKGSKADRAAPVAACAKQGRIHHVSGAMLDALERLQTSWIPPAPGVRAARRRSPDALDAYVIAVTEVAGLRVDAQDPVARLADATTAQAALARLTTVRAPQRRSPSALASMLPRLMGRI